MKKLLVFILVGLTSCTMKTPPNMKAEYVIQRYLDSVNNPDRIVILKLTELLNVNENYIDREKQNIYKYDPYFKNKSAIEKKDYLKKVDTIYKLAKGYTYCCNYSIKGYKHIVVIKLDTTLSKVGYITEMEF